MEIKRHLKKHASSEKAKILARFFKTGKGEYGEGDVFLGIHVPDVRSVAKEFHYLPFDKVKDLLKSKIHEERLAALLLLVHKYQIGDEKEKERVFNFYLKNTKYVNSWDLVDLTADKILGEHLLNKPKTIIYKLAKSSNLWERRISIVATFQFIKSNKFDDTLKISELLLNDDHDLVQKAVGWMLREVGKRDSITEEKFLQKYYKRMHRTTLRYAIERFPENKRRFYLKS